MNFLLKNHIFSKNKFLLKNRIFEKKMFYFCQYYIKKQKCAKSRWNNSSSTSRKTSKTSPKLFKCRYVRKNISERCVHKRLSNYLSKYRCINPIMETRKKDSSSSRSKLSPKHHLKTRLNQFMYFRSFRK